MPIKSKAIIIGSFPGIRRSDLASLLESFGVSVQWEITSDLDYIIAGSYCNAALAEVDRIGCTAMLTTAELVDGKIVMHKY